MRNFLGTVLGTVGTVLETVVGTVVNYIGTVTFLFRGLDSAGLIQKPNSSYIIYNSSYNGSYNGSYNSYNSFYKPLI